MRKKDVYALLEHFPDGEIDGEQLIEELCVKIKIERAEAEVARGELLTHDEVVEQSEKWFERS